MTILDEDEVMQIQLCAHVSRKSHMAKFELSHKERAQSRRMVSNSFRQHGYILFWTLIRHEHKLLGSSATS